MTQNTGERTYHVRTWDSEAQAFTQQKGVPLVAQGLGGLRHALRLLRDLGYPACKGDSSTSVERAT